MTSRKLIKKKKEKKINRLPFLLIVPTIVLLFFITLIGTFELRYANKFYPGVMIAGESVGGRTHDDVLQEFKEKSDVLLKDGLSLVLEKTDGKKEINIPATITGLNSDTLVEYFSIVDLEANIARAYAWGHKGTVIQRLKEQFASILGKNFTSPVSPHKEAIQSLISRETKNFLVTGVPANFSLDRNNKIIITPEKLGDNIDATKIVATILQKFNSFEIQPIVFKLQPETPYPTEDKLRPFLELAQEFAKSLNINFYYQNHKWKVSGKTLATWLTLKSDYEMTVDDKKIETFLSASVAPLINDPPQNSRFEMRKGNLVEIYPGKSGHVVNINKTIEPIEKIIPRVQKSFATTKNFTAALIIAVNDSKNQFNTKLNVIDVPVETIKINPSITQKTINQYGIKDLIGRAQTNFKNGSLDRQHNIEVGVSKITGILIAPDEEFSTIKTLGEITEETGFVKELIIKENRNVKELGGGLCQLATTLFRMAIDAGLPITERTNHKYVIPFYGPGLDATIYGPHPDFRFVNDTGNYLLLQGTAKNNEVTFELYGVADGRTAEVSTPILYDEKPVPETRNIITIDLPAGEIKCSTATFKGITADTAYTVRYPNGYIKQKFFHSVYEAWPKVCLIGISSDLLRLLQ